MSGIIGKLSCLQFYIKLLPTAHIQRGSYDAPMMHNNAQFMLVDSKWYNKQNVDFGWCKNMHYVLNIYKLTLFVVHLFLIILSFTLTL